MQKEEKKKMHLNMMNQHPSLQATMASNAHEMLFKKTSTAFTNGNSMHSFLAESFVPDHRHVICGRGKKVFDHSGNQNFRSMVLDRLADYKKARSKVQKSAVVSSVFDDVTSNGAFVKQDTLTRRWYIFNEHAAREKISQFFRDCLTNRYQSSKKFNEAKRKVAQEQDKILDLPRFSRTQSAPAKLVSAPSGASTSAEAFRELLLFSQEVMPGPNGASSTLPTLADTRHRFKDFEDESLDPFPHFVHSHQETEELPFTASIDDFDDFFDNATTTSL